MAAQRFGAGRLHHRVGWDRRENAADGYGGTKSRYAEQFECLAGLVPLRGGEGVLAARLVGRQPFIVQVRADSRTRLIAHGWRMREVRKGEWIGSGADRRWSGTTYLVKSITFSKDHPLFLDVLVESEGTV